MERTRAAGAAPLTDAQRRLVTDNLRLVRWAARRIWPAARWHMGFDDLLGESYLALVLVAGRYVQGGTSSFRNYACLKMPFLLLDALRSRRWAKCSTDPETGRKLPRPHARSLAFDPASRPEPSPWEGELPDELTRGLTPTEHQIVQGYYVRGRLMREIGAEMGISQSRVSQLHDQAVTFLRGKLTRQAAGGGND